jgi:hypothetical protein
LFPFFDAVSVALSEHDDGMQNRVYDTLEECVTEIEELKTELSIIQITQTSTGRDRWDTPEVVIGTGRKKKLTKDRYSSLLMANMAARTLQRTPAVASPQFYGGFATGGHEVKKDEKMYAAPAWFEEQIKDVY